MIESVVCPDGYNLVDNTCVYVEFDETTGEVEVTDSVPSEEIDTPEESE